jgi:GTP-binding protein
MHTFLDEARVFVQSGDGGKGAMHFRREKYVPLGGPDGGDGGQGGSIIFQADRGLNTLFAFRRNRRFVAQSGDTGGPSRMHGRNGEDTVVKVPVGTVLMDGDTGELLGDLTRDGQTLQVARGGRGGLGNVHFKSSTNQAPHFAEKGEPGQERWIDLELKVIADVGFIGFPNAGKSTLLSVMSAAHPKIADYPFTTLSPNLGVVDAGDFDFVAADIPGLIEGAHEGVGLGHEFLRHIERTLILVHVVDGSTDDPLEAFRQVNHELKAHDEALMQKAQIVVVNKLDLPAAQARWPELRSAFVDQGYEALAVSAITRQGVDALVFRLAQFLAEERRLAGVPNSTQAEAGSEVETIVIKPPASHFEVERRRKTFHVTGEDVERLAVMTDTSSDEALYRLQRRLKQMGVIAALERAGAREGSKVRIGTVEFAWDSSYETEGAPKRTRSRSKKAVGNHR